MKNTIRQLTDREHVRLRSAVYIGSVTPTKSFEYILDNDAITHKEVEYSAGLIKIINEILDNSVDVAIKSNFKSANLIQVKIDDKKVIVQDNGTGIPVVKNSDGIYLPRLAWGNARAGSNFDDDKNRTQIGLNGVGSFATNCFSKKFIGLTDDGKNAYKVTFKNGAESFTEQITPTKKQGTTVTFEPDLEMFGVSSINETYQNIIKQRLINLSMSFPKITFKFNGKKVNTSTFKNYLKLFSNTAEIYETEDYKFAVLPNEDDDFKQFSYVNGLKIPDGGTHIDIITNSIVDSLRNKLIKKYKTIKPGDIRNKLMIILFMKNFNNAKFSSQSKEKITNSTREINEYFGKIDYEKIVNKILKTPEIIDPITEVYKIKEEFKKRQELKSLKKTKRIKSSKYLPSTGFKKYLVLVEGESALGGLLGALGRKDVGYYTLKGKPLNSYSQPQSKFTSNKELSELYSIIKNENYQYIITACDADLDGIHIIGLLLGFFHKYTPEVNTKIGMLNTPVIAVKKGKDLKRWYYNLNDEVIIKQGESSKYYKGLGSHKEKDLKYIIEKDGLAKMIKMFEFDDDEIIDDWLSDKKADKRKEYIINNEFSIAKL